MSEGAVFKAEWLLPSKQTWLQRLNCWYWRVTGRSKIHVGIDRSSSETVVEAIHYPDGRIEITKIETRPNT